jgi:hypothetical protein
MSSLATIEPKQVYVAPFQPAPSAWRIATTEGENAAEEAPTGLVCSAAHKARYAYCPSSDGLRLDSTSIPTISARIRAS